MTEPEILRIERLLLLQSQAIDRLFVKLDRIENKAEQRDKALNGKLDANQAVVVGKLDVILQDVNAPPPVVSLKLMLSKGALQMEVMSIGLPTDGTPVHFTVVDQDLDAIMSGAGTVGWVLDASLSGVSFAQDADNAYGFAFSAAPGTPAETGNAVATYTPADGSPVVSMTWPVVVGGAKVITALRLTSP